MEHSAEKDVGRLWRVGDPIDYADPNCDCATSGMGRKTECRVHGANPTIPPRVTSPEGTETE